MKTLKKNFKENKKKFSTEEKLLNLVLIKKEGKDLKVTRGLGIILGMYVRSTNINCARFKGKTMDNSWIKKNLQEIFFEKIEKIQNVFRKSFKFKQ